MSDEQNHFLLLGGPEHVDFFANYEEQSIAEQWFWSVPRCAKEGDAAFVYLTAPESRIVGKVLITGEPFYHLGNTMFDNPKTKDKWMAEIRAVAYYPPRHELTMRGLRSLFPEWPWLSYPRSATKIPAGLLQPILELTKSSEGGPHE